ncbi:hypothetical protein BST96_04420 [Oceanicoccus sagamiensis]|uniref:Uncharacterized protein n=2 Tax=Oceanicoccus sagamiensis TaxID=716816 RepID=A0A1X9NNG0_9GAMM|nr:hypothetical protein BST96_04420 [Oceanicoccus sagamiensis]
MEAIIELLLANGNTLARADRWHNDMAATICFVTEPVDFDLIEGHFELPPCVRLSKDRGAIECDETWRTIQGPPR